MGMLALAIAPHIDALRELQPGTSLERFMARLVSELIEDRCSRIKAAMGPLQKQASKSGMLFPRPFPSDFLMWCIALTLGPM